MGHSLILSKSQITAVVLTHRTPFVPPYAVQDFMALYNTELDPSLRCADDFTRYDTEFISTKVAEAYNCSF